MSPGNLGHTRVEMTIPGYWFGGSHPESSLTGAAQCRFAGHNRQCTFAYRACSRIRSPISPYPQKTRCRIPSSIPRYALWGRVRGLAWYW